MLYYHNCLVWRNTRQWIKETLRSFIRAGASLDWTPTHPEVFHFVGLESEILTNLPASTTRIARTRFGLEDTQGWGGGKIFAVLLKAREATKQIRMDASRLSRLEPYNYVLRIVTYVLSKLLDLLATKGIRGILWWDYCQEWRRSACFCINSHNWHLGLSDKGGPP